MGLYHELTEYGKKNIYPMHMPGHKRNMAFATGFATDTPHTFDIPYTLDTPHMLDIPYTLDISEIDGFDNLTYPQGIIKDCMDRASRLWGSTHTFLLVNGATVGILTAVSALAKPGSAILMMRNSHLSVHNAAFINKLDIEYLYPDTVYDLGILGSIPPSDVKQKLNENPRISLVVITSPTYDGVISDIREIAGIAHDHGVPLLVDAAHGSHLGFHPSGAKHGSHLGFHPKFYENANALGADVVIHSIHKTLPALTQTALMHVNGMDVRTFKKYLSIYQTSSPSYILMAGIERCISYLEDDAFGKFGRFYNMLDDFYTFMEKLKHMKVFTSRFGQYKDLCMDPSKILVYSLNNMLTGRELHGILLHEHGIQSEMVGTHHVLLMTSVCDTDEGFKLLKNALLSIDEHISEGIKASSDDEPANEKIMVSSDYNDDNGRIRNKKDNDRKYSPYQLVDKREKTLTLRQSVGNVIMEYIYAYPPGTPLIIPGEVMEDHVVMLIERYKAAGIGIYGMEDDACEYVRVLQ